MNAAPDDTLERARRQAGLTHTELWLRYFALGGMSNPTELEGYLHGALRPTAHERNIIVHAINERHVELGQDHPVPYAGESED
jgi:hypothetical protein